MNISKNDKTKITGYDHDYLNELINGPIENIFKNNLLLREIGNVVDTNTNEVISEITPMIMLINQSRPGFLDAFNKFMDNVNIDSNYLVEYDKEINYYGHTESARSILEKYRS